MIDIGLADELHIQPRHGCLSKMHAALLQSLPRGVGGKQLTDAVCQEFLLRRRATVPPYALQPVLLHVQTVWPWLVYFRWLISLNVLRQVVRLVGYNAVGEPHVSAKAVGEDF